ncbi:MAG: hypothetical protein AB7Q30_22945 [Vicinamibacteria bacterium]
MARIFRWEEAPLPYRLMVAHTTSDPEPRAYLALVSSSERPTHEEKAFGWADVLRVPIEDNQGLAGVRTGDLLIAGNRPSASSSEP